MLSLPSLCIHPAVNPCSSLSGMECGALPLEISAVCEITEIWESPDALPSPRTFLPLCHWQIFCASPKCLWDHLGAAFSPLEDLGMFILRTPWHHSELILWDKAGRGISLGGCGSLQDSGIGPGSLQLHVEISWRPEGH